MPTEAATRRIMHELNKMQHETSMRVSLPDEANCYCLRADLSVDEASPLGRDLCSHAARVGGEAPCGGCRVVRPAFRGMRAPALWAYGLFSSRIA